MNEDSLDSIPVRKKEHLELCLTDKVSFKNKTTGFEKYDFVHHAITEVEIDEINFSRDFFGKKINYPFLISCMTGGTSEAENINAQLAIAAAKVGIPIGVGSQRQLLEDKSYIKSYKVIRENAKNIPVLANLGAAQVCKMKSPDDVRFLIDVVEADAFVVHVNPLQELVQRRGEPDFKGLLKALEKITGKIDLPVIVKEVGSGISKSAALELLNVGVKGIDVAGAGGTSWSGVEFLRNKKRMNSENSSIADILLSDYYSSEEEVFWDWGLPTAYCIRTVAKLKKKKDFLLIGSGGINTALDAAKALALGADMVASARIILQTLNKNGIDGVRELIYTWFGLISNILFLTGAKSLKSFQKNKLIKTEDMW